MFLLSLPSWAARNPAFPAQKRCGEKDLLFNRALAQRGLVTHERLLQLLEKTHVNAAVRDRIRGDIANHFRFAANENGKLPPR